MRRRDSAAARRTPDRADRKPDAKARQRRSEAHPRPRRPETRCEGATAPQRGAPPTAPTGNPMRRRDSAAARRTPDRADRKPDAKARQRRSEAHPRPRRPETRCEGATAPQRGAPPTAPTGGPMRRRESAAASAPTRGPAQQKLTDVPLLREVLRHEDGPPRGAHARVVRDEEVFHAVRQRRVLAQAADDGGHAAFGVAVEADLRAEGIVGDADEVLGRRVKLEGAEIGAELAPGRLDLVEPGLLAQLDEDGLGVALE